MADQEPVSPQSGRGSRDVGFRAWLAMNDYLLECEFLDGDVTGMPDEPYSEAGLRVAEAEMLRRFSGIDDALASANREMFDKFIRFVGAAFVNGLGFQWTNKPAGHDDGKAYIAVEMPSIDTQLSVSSLVTAAAKRRTGDEWAFVYRNMRESAAAQQSD
ncbi:MAG: hypothetical protein DLM58_09885 [Pseudonocardiales bacterium]|nr:MAG: hypothetical protein DLM58_09885 [Pseudonocardiales bacterium]